MTSSSRTRVLPLLLPIAVLSTGGSILLSSTGTGLRPDPAPPRPVVASAVEPQSPAAEDTPASVVTATSPVTADGVVVLAPPSERPRRSGSSEEPVQPLGRAPGGSAAAPEVRSVGAPTAPRSPAAAPSRGPGTSTVAPALPDAGSTVPTTPAPPVAEATPADGWLGDPLSPALPALDVDQDPETDVPDGEEPQQAGAGDASSTSRTPPAVPPSPAPTDERPTDGPPAEVDADGAQVDLDPVHPTPPAVDTAPPAPAETPAAPDVAASDVPGETPAAEPTAETPAAPGASAETPAADHAPAGTPPSGLDAAHPGDLEPSV